MKISKRQLRRIIKEEIATINDETIEDTVMGILSDEGGAAGLEPIESALEDLEDEEMSLPDEPIEDLIGNVAGVKRHADGDYVDSTQLERRELGNLRITENQLRLIVRRAILNEGRFADVVRGIGKHGSKILTRPAGIIAKVFGRLATSKDSSGYESRIDANVEGLEQLVGDLLYLPGRGLEVGYDEFKKLVKKYKPDASEKEIADLEDQIEIEKSKKSDRSPPVRRASAMGRRQLAAESRVRKLLRTL